MDTEIVVPLYNGLLDIYCSTSGTVVSLLHLAIRNNYFRKFLGKSMQLEAIIMSEIIQSQKNTHGTHSLISEY